MSTTASKIRELVHPYREKRDGLAAAIFTLDVLIYLSLFVLTIFVESLILKGVLSVGLGIMTGLLFIVGHDCCHGSFMSKKNWNRWLGTAAFLPSLHSFKLWDLGHNRTHHRFTNLSTEDYVYTPLSPVDYHSLNWLGKLRYRIYRSVPGHMVYYMVEIWAKKMIIPHRGVPHIGALKNYRADSLLLAFYLLTMGLLSSFMAIFLEESVLAALFFSLILPFLVWNWIMGFVIYQHHTNKFTRWFTSAEEWEYWEAQLVDTVHISFPKPINFLLHNIMEHNAHHCNIDIPLYNLPRAQARLADEYSDQVKKVDWTLNFYLESVRMCKLYDYESHKWVGFQERKFN